jgi:hypothetical protein
MYILKRCKQCVAGKGERIEKKNMLLLMSHTSVLVAYNMELCLIMYTAHCKLYNLDRMKNTEKRQEYID